ncbi:MAG: amidophosphoribosyltransferase [Candidatus Anstonellales archaeon]
MLRHSCGVVALFSRKGNVDIVDAGTRALKNIQSRGEDAWGYSILHEDRIKTKKHVGLVEVGSGTGRIGIFHVRYPTTSKKIETEKDAQPSHLGELAVAHNGNIHNYDEIKKSFRGKYSFKGSADSEAILAVLYEELKNGKDMENALIELSKKAKGSYALVGIWKNKLFATKDMYGIRPLVFGWNEYFYAFASETVAFQPLNILNYEEVKPGELYIIENGELRKKQILKKIGERRCMFEFVYFANPASEVFGEGVYKTRFELGKRLAEENPVEADFVIPIPDTARTAAEGFGEATGIPVKEAIVKNRYVGRTFIQPNEEKRVELAKQKYFFLTQFINGKRVVLIDDSIVRGTTTKILVEKLRELGVKEVHLMVTCPPLKAPCYYGIDMKTEDELIAAKKSVEEIKKFLNVDSLGYMSIEGLKKVLGKNICTGCLNKEYPDK